MLRNFINRILSWLRSLVYMGGLGDVFALWQGAGAKERGIFLLTFAPMFICIGGLLFSVVSFVLFVLPSFVLRFLGWMLLIALFGAGGRYCYGHITGRAARYGADAGATFHATFTSSSSGSNYSGPAYEATYTDVKFTEDSPAGSAATDTGSSANRERGDQGEIRRTIFRKSRPKE